MENRVIKSRDRSMLEQHVAVSDAAMRAIMNNYGPTTIRYPDHKPLNEITNADLVMEMLKRGFAVMKLPADGGPPKALRDEYVA